MVLNAIIQTEEKERTRIAQDLHDSLGPLLSAVKLYSNSIIEADDIRKRKDIYNKINNLMSEATDTVKKLSNNLSSHLLKNFGLKEAIKSFSETIEATFPIKIITEISPDFRAKGEIQMTLYRVLVELINNTLKYAEAKKIRIRIKIIDNRLELTYSDDGIGFEEEKVLKEKKGMGLYNIHSRIKSLGGSINIQSKPGHGTNVKIII